MKSPLFAYGMRVAELSITNDLRGAPTREWPTVALDRVRAAAPVTTRVAWSPTAAKLAAAGYCTVQVKHEPLAVRVESPAPLSDEELAHPLLAFVGASVARWTNRSAFHGAAVMLHGRAWVLLASPGGGKSTLSSRLTARGEVVLADDLSVIDDDTVLAGPRSCDLRRESAARLGISDERRSTDARGRWRDRLGPAPYEVPLGGFVALAWAERVTTRRAGTREKLELLTTHEALGRGPTAPSSFLDLLHFPFLELSRPQAWDRLDTAIDLLIDVTGG